MNITKILQNSKKNHFIVKAKNSDSEEPIMEDTTESISDYLKNRNSKVQQEVNRYEANHLANNLVSHEDRNKPRHKPQEFATISSTASLMNLDVEGLEEQLENQIPPQQRASLKKELGDMVLTAARDEIDKRINNNPFSFVAKTAWRAFSSIGRSRRKEKSVVEIVEEVTNENLTENRDKAEGIATVAAATATAATSAHVIHQHPVIARSFGKWITSIAHLPVIKIIIAPFTLINTWFSPTNEKVATTLLKVGSAKGAFTFTVAKGLVIFFAAIINALIVGLFIYYFTKILFHIHEIRTIKVPKVFRRKELPLPKRETPVYEEDNDANY